MTMLSDAAVRRLRAAGEIPALDGDRYTVIRELGKGGMGTVYAAFDAVLQREVALKVPNTVASAALEHRLRTEARVLAHLEHPGIVPIHDSGRLSDGRLFYVMKLVKGRTLGEQLPQLADLSERLTIFERLCDPVAFAHAQGFVHRDLKPDNVMLGAFGEVMVMDWGVAKVLAGATESAPGTATDAAGRATTSGLVLGTRGFMSPEQASAGVVSVDARADVYSLGAILYMLLTNDEPPDAAAAQRIEARGDVPRPLRAICAQALDAEPQARYQTVKALADDIARYRAGLAVHAHPETLVDRTRRVARTYRTPILLVLAYIVMRAIVAFTVGW
jgi:eukaryotic-like serine/threonine-protein kinase